MQNIRDSSAVDSNFGSMAYDKERGEDFSKILVIWQKEECS